eukprot:468858-Pelagomonas_calceolata.AAC.2
MATSAPDTLSTITRCSSSSTHTHTHSPLLTCITVLAAALVQPPLTPPSLEPGAAAAASRASQQAACWQSRRRWFGNRSAQSGSPPQLRCRTTQIASRSPATCKGVRAGSEASCAGARGQCA